MVRCMRAVNDDSVDPNTNLMPAAGGEGKYAAMLMQLQAAQKNADAKKIQTQAAVDEKDDEAAKTSFFTSPSGQVAGMRPTQITPVNLEESDNVKKQPSSSSMPTTRTLRKNQPKSTVLARLSLSKTKTLSVVTYESEASPDEAAAAASIQKQQQGGVKIDSRSFPLTIHRLVNDLSVSRPDLVWWVEDGSAFDIDVTGRKGQAFSKAMVPYFQHGRFESLRRQLNVYGWSKKNGGRYDGVYYNPQFHRDASPEQLALIQRKKRDRRNQSKLAKKKAARALKPHVHAKTIKSPMSVKNLPGKEPRSVTKPKPVVSPKPPEDSSPVFVFPVVAGPQKEPKYKSNLGCKDPTAISSKPDDNLDEQEAIQTSPLRKKARVESPKPDEQAVVVNNIGQFSMAAVDFGVAEATLGLDTLAAAAVSLKKSPTPPGISFTPLTKQSEHAAIVESASKNATSLVTVKPAAVKMALAHGQTAFSPIHADKTSSPYGTLSPVAPGVDEMIQQLPSSLQKTPAPKQGHWPLEPMAEFNSPCKPASTEQLGYPETPLKTPGDSFACTPITLSSLKRPQIASPAYMEPFVGMTGDLLDALDVSLPEDVEHVEAV